MKYSHQCPKCDSLEIYVKPYSSINNEGGSIITSVFSYARMDRYICGTCGYVETFLSSQEEIDKVVDKLKKYD